MYARISTTIIAIGCLHPPKRKLCLYYRTHFVLHGQDLLCKRRDPNHYVKNVREKKHPEQYLHNIIRKLTFFVQPFLTKEIRTLAPFDKKLGIHAVVLPFLRLFK